MTCKEKIDEIEKILDDEYETKIERIREVVDDVEDKAIPLDKIKKAMEQIIDEKEFAYADFNEYKREVLGVEDVDDLPDDDFRYGMERCLEILNVLIAESEEQNL